MTITAFPLNPGDVLSFEYHDKRFMAKSIAFVTKSPYTHSATYLGNGKVGEACSSGFKINPFDRYLNECDSIAVLPFPGTPRQAADLVIMAETYADANLKYGWIDVIALGLAHYGIRNEAVMHRLRTPRTGFCSQMASRLMRRAGINVHNLLGKPDYETAPVDLTTVPGVVIHR